MTVQFRCQDEESGLATCSRPVTVTEETKERTIVGTAVDKAGNRATSSVSVRVDKTPPTVDLTWPPVEDFTTNFPRVRIEGAVSDSLSGVATVGRLEDARTEKVSPSKPRFSFMAELDARISKGELAKENPIDLVATDSAGNRTKRHLVVRYTRGNAMTPTDAEATETHKGIRTSVNRVMLRFKRDVSKEAVFDLVTRAEGNVAGFLPRSRTAVAHFGTRSVAELLRVVESLERSHPDLLDAEPVVFWQPQQLDNELLAGDERVAYDAVDLTEAQSAIVGSCQECHYRNRVGVGIIDSGLHTAYGANAEFRDIETYDLNTFLGQNGIPGMATDHTGHGTKITGVLAGANNGSGNNGVVGGVTDGSAFDVKLFKTHSSSSDGGFDHSLIMTALDLITEGVVPGIDVVNLGYGLGATTPEAEEWLMFSHWNYFDSPGGKDILWVAPAGNNDEEVRCDGFLIYPAGMACRFWNVASVGGFDPQDRTRAQDSNHGDAVTVYAPGESVYTANRVGGYGFAGGTSISTAFVTGAVALFKAFNSFHPPSLMRQALRTTAELSSDGALTMRQLKIDDLMSGASMSPFLDDKPYSGTSNGGSENPPVPDNVTRPGLAGFFFDFYGGDHEIDVIQTGFFMADPQNVLNSATFLDYSDMNNDDDYAWRVDVRELPYGTRFFEKRGENKKGGFNLRLQYPVVGVPVLLGFEVRSREGDREIERIKIELLRTLGALYLDMVFEGEDEFRYDYAVTYALVPPDRVKTMGSNSGDVDDESGSDSRAIDARQPVLRGFELKFDNGEHHLNEMGVRLSSRRARVWFCDKNKDDPFSWTVHWVNLQ